MDLVMRKHKKLKQFVYMVFALLMAFSVTVHAEDKTGTITVVNKALSGEILPNIHVSLYKVADFTNGENSGAKFTDEFADLDLDFASLSTSADAEQSAIDCLSYINGNNIEARQTLISDEAGQAVFTNIEKGVYLITQTSEENAAYQFTSTPFFVQMPATDKDGNVNYQVTTYPKNGVTYPQESYDISVVKIWKDNNNRDKTRPESIQVGLYGNGELNETVTLSDINNWSYAWNDLSKDVNWDVQEIEIPDSYRMKSERNQNQFIITNQLVIHRDTVTHGMIETVKGDKTTIKSVVTGDTTMLGFYVALFAFSGLMILVYAKHCKNQN